MLLLQVYKSTVLRFIQSGDHTPPNQAHSPFSMPAGDTDTVFRNKVRAGDLMDVKKMLKDGVGFDQPAKTIRGWTPLHTACWGSAKPQYDRDIVEAILSAAKGNGTEEKVRGAQGIIDGETPLDLAKERRDALVGGSGDDKEQLDEKRAPHVGIVGTERLACASRRIGGCSRTNALTRRLSPAAAGPARVSASPCARAAWPS